MKTTIKNVQALDAQVIQLAAAASRFKFWTKEANDIQDAANLKRLEASAGRASLSKKQLEKYLSY